MANELKRGMVTPSTEVSANGAATPTSPSDESAKPLDTPRATDAHPSSWQPLRPKANGVNDSAQSTAHPNDRLKRSIDSESGTEADDEHFLLGVPASRSKHQKELKQLERTISATPTSGLSDGQDGKQAPRSAKETKLLEIRKIMEAFSQRRRIELLRRISEVGLLLGLGCIVYSGDEREEARLWKTELGWEAAIIGSLMALYPIRLLYYLASHNSFEKWPSIVVPSSFDPAVLLYPPLLANYASVLLSEGNGPIILINSTLGISSLLTELLPSFTRYESAPTLHWLLSCIPVFVWQTGTTAAAEVISHEFAGVRLGEALTFLFPLHRTMCAVLRQLAATSLLETEVQLMSIALINLACLAQSPAMIVLKSLLWIGGVSLALFGTFAFRWLVAVERVPRWRFRRVGSPKHALKSQPKSILKEPLGKLSEILHFDRPPTLDSEEDDVASVKRVKPMKLRSEPEAASPAPSDPTCAASDTEVADSVAPLRSGNTSTASTSRTLDPITHTPSGRKKRSASKSLAQFYNLTETEATIRKYIYASYIYVLILITIFAFIYTHVSTHALSGLSPIGWALSYLFGDLPLFRWKITLWNLNTWIPLPPHLHSPLPQPGTSPVPGWLSQKRNTFGHANTRLLISLYLLTILAIGLTTVFSLSRLPSIAVDTRRKVFHFMMVFMLAPTIFVDPTYLAFALGLILAIFLLLDLLRSSCVPPVAKPVNWFLAPYVDGRDLRGPVVVSHIFLLIGCAIPLWLSLGTLPLSATEAQHGDWEVEKSWNIDGERRDLSMLSGVLCVGIGDAFASLIGRRFGVRKWIWTGGKTIEGSLAFAGAVTLALVAGKGYLVWGEWGDAGVQVGGWGWMEVAGKSGLAAGVASGMEAVLTGGNDNVVVPVVFWMCVRGLGI